MKVTATLPFYLQEFSMGGLAILDIIYERMPEKIRNDILVCYASAEQLPLETYSLSSFTNSNDANRVYSSKILNNTVEKIPNEVERIRNETVYKVSREQLTPLSNPVLANVNNGIKKMDSKEIIEPKNFLTSSIAGGVAGAVAKTTIAPLDRTKINFQITNKHYSLKEASKFILESCQKSGFLSLWRGNSATMARIIPYASIQFTAHEQWKHILHVETLEEKRCNPGKSFLAGSLAGIVSTTCTYPLDLARARMAVTHKEMYNSITQVFIKTWKKEGCATLYRGYAPTLLGVIPYSGTSFFTYETLKRLHSERTDRPIHPTERMLYGAMSGMLGQSASYPLDIVRRRMQTASLTGSIYDTIRSTIRIIIKEEGIIKGLYKGLSLNWIKGPIAVGISFTTFDLMQMFLKNCNLFSNR